MESSYPEVGMFGKQMPAYALWLAHAKGLKIKTEDHAWQGRDARPPNFLFDVEDFEEAGWTLPDQPITSAQFAHYRATMEW